MDRSSRQNVNKEIVDLNEKLDEMDLIDIYRALHPKMADYIFFSSAHGIFSKIDYMLRNKASFDKFKKIEIISSIFYDYNNMKLEINYKTTTRKNTNMWRQYATKHPFVV